MKATRYISGESAMQHDVIELVDNTDMGALPGALAHTGKVKHGDPYIDLRWFGEGQEGEGTPPRNYQFDDGYRAIRFKLVRRGTCADVPRRGTIDAKINKAVYKLSTLKNTHMRRGMEAYILKLYEQSANLSVIAVKRNAVLRDIASRKEKRA